ncbi:hypothetical protein [[Clostridium] innocuum]|uniref:hypothetical protein n=1 Tax=Clostridium innocuum TaxID=1522 RepID=UPI001F062514|nr:hypothetical protein [[Clostridium] innocuum]MCH1947569.1 hypothetical protein [[Clostridium] innocuum]
MIQAISRIEGCVIIAVILLCKRAKIHQAKLVLASATPSLESYARAHKGIYQLVEMPKRINEQFPQVKLVEMREAVKKKESYLMSNALLDAFIHDYSVRNK